MVCQMKAVSCNATIKDRGINVVFNCGLDPEGSISVELSITAVAMVCPASTDKHSVKTDLYREQCYSIFSQEITKYLDFGGIVRLVV